MGFKTVGLTEKFQKMRDRHYQGQVLKKFGQHIYGVIHAAKDHKQLGKHPGGDLYFLTEGQNKDIHQNAQNKSTGKKPP